MEQLGCGEAESAEQRGGVRFRKKHVWSPVGRIGRDREEGMLGPTRGKLWTYLGFFPKGEGRERGGSMDQALLVAAGNTKVDVIRENTSPLVSQPSFTSPFSCT